MDYSNTSLVVLLVMGEDAGLDDKFFDGIFEKPRLKTGINFRILRLSCGTVKPSGELLGANLILFHYDSQTKQYLPLLQTISNLNPTIAIVIIVSHYDEKIFKWSLRAKMKDCVVVPDELPHLETIVDQVVSRPVCQKDSLGITGGYPRVQPALDYVNANIGRKIVLSELARLCNMSVSNFSLKFKQCVGMNLRNYINHCRIQAAKNMLVGTDFSVKQIALRLGFDDTSHLGRRFKALENITPGQYRDAHKLGKNLKKPS